MNSITGSSSRFAHEPLVSWLLAAYAGKRTGKPPCIRAQENLHANFAKQQTAVYIRCKRFPQRAEHGAHMELRHIPSKKMNGLGNDFVMIDARAGAAGLRSPQI
jgi:hypothetical protein